ncbi:MAG: calcium/sodium antiporter [Candidatus Lokiarchaeota archaeon]|nr:calcium/sodium antiporter [Candidatus Lokiarchaeota archaeon]MBD3200938.1 calcium/sodium antiporter [Candidatus Lokiarchaeota archaeon]
MIAITILFLLLGGLGLYFGAKFVITGLEDIALRFGVSHILVGLTILSIGTSLPEIAVSVLGGLDKFFGIDTAIDGIVIGNKIGSFFTQITLVLGILGLVQPIFISKWKLRREGSMMFISVLIFIIFTFDGLLVKYEAILLIISYIVYLIFIIISEKKIEKKQEEIRRFIAERDGIEFEVHKHEEKKEKSKVHLLKEIGYTILGLFLLIFGAQLALISGHDIAKLFNIPESIVGIFIIGLETSLPELIADITAIRRNSAGIAVGDILGSNVCDILLATGSGALIVDFNVPLILLYFDIPMLLLAIGLVCYFLFSKKNLNRWEAGLLVLYYSTYTILKLFFFQI